MAPMRLGRSHSCWPPQEISDASNDLNADHASCSIQTAAETGNVGVDGVRGRLAIEAINILQNLVAGYDSPRRTHEQFEDCEFASRQNEQAAADSDLPRRRIEDDIADC